MVAERRDTRRARASTWSERRVGGADGCLLIRMGSRFTVVLFHFGLVLAVVGVYSNLSAWRSGFE